MLSHLILCILNDISTVSFVYVVSGPDLSLDKVLNAIFVGYNFTWCQKLKPYNARINGATEASRPSFDGRKSCGELEGVDTRF